jgi:hypothetical protein
VSRPPRRFRPLRFARKPFRDTVAREATTPRQASRNRVRRNSFAGRRSVIIFVDYDNILRHHRQRGLRFVVERTVSRLVSAGAPVPNRIRVRLYGGWYEGETLSRRAQIIAREVRGEFPCTVPLADSSGRDRIVVTAELALALELDPASHLHHTFRAQLAPLDIRCRDPHAIGCAHEHCPTEIVRQFFHNGGCTRDGCSLRLQDVLYRAGQKLVDTMLTSDLIYLATYSGKHLVVVSSDDDLWPGIRTALALGAHTIQVHTHKGFSTRQIYARPRNCTYEAVEFD